MHKHNKKKKIYVIRFVVSKSQLKLFFKNPVLLKRKRLIDKKKISIVSINKKIIANIINKNLLPKDIYESWNSAIADKSIFSYNGVFIYMSICSYHNTVEEVIMKKDIIPHSLIRFEVVMGGSNVELVIK